MEVWLLKGPRVWERLVLLRLDLGQSRRSRGLGGDTLWTWACISVGDGGLPFLRASAGVPSAAGAPLPVKTVC